MQTKMTLKRDLVNGKIITVPVESTNISTWSYNPNNACLSILFKKGTLYKYSEVDLNTIFKLIDCESVGKQFRNTIMDKFDYKRYKFDGSIQYEVCV